MRPPCRDAQPELLCAREAAGRAGWAGPRAAAAAAAGGPQARQRPGTPAPHGRREHGHLGASAHRPRCTQVLTNVHTRPHTGAHAHTLFSALEQRPAIL